MKKVLILTAAIVTAGLLYAFIPREAANDAQQGSKNANSNSEVQKPGGPINWMSWEEAVKANEKNPKKIFIDFYTDWCGWCKRMDATTFSDPEVAQYINKNFYPVKFDAEQKEDIEFMGTTYKFMSYGRRGTHMLAIELLDGKNRRIGYPSYVYLTPKYERILISPGFKQVPDMKKELTFVAEDHYSSTSWDEFRAAN